MNIRKRKANDNMPAVFYGRQFTDHSRQHITAAVNSFFSRRYVKTASPEYFFAMRFIVFIPYPWFSASLFVVTKLSPSVFGAVAQELTVMNLKNDVPLLSAVNEIRFSSDAIAASYAFFNRLSSMHDRSLSEMKSKFSARTSAE